MILAMGEIMINWSLSFLTFDVKVPHIPSIPEFQWTCEIASSYVEKTLDLQQA